MKRNVKNIRLACTAVLVLALVASLVLGTSGLATGATKIKFTFPLSGVDVDLRERTFAQLVEQFNKMNPDIHVEMETLVEAEGASMLTMLMARAKSGEVSDVFVMGGGAHIAQFLQGDLIAPVTKYIDKTQFVKATLLPSKLATRPDSLGEIFEVPYTVKVGIVGYNRDIFNDAGITPPTTWDEHLSNLAKLKARGVVPLIRSGREAAGLTLWLFQEWLRALSGDDDLFDQIFVTMEKGVDNAYVRRALEMFKQESQYYGTGWETASTAQDIEPLFFRGKLAIMGGSGRLIRVVEKEFPGLKVGLYKPPTIGGRPWEVRAPTEGLGIAKLSKNKDEAARFIQFMTGEDAQLKYLQNFLDLPTRESVYGRPELKEVFKKYPDFKALADYRSNAFGESLSLFSKQAMGLIGKGLAETMAKVGMGKLTVDEAVTALSNMQKQLREPAR